MSTFPKKKGKANPFLMFLLEYRRTEADKGNQMEMSEAQEKAGEIWDKMDSFERSKYNVLSSRSKVERERPKKYTSFGVSLDEIDRQRDEEKKRLKLMELTIEEMLLTAKEENKLNKLTFHFFCASYFVQTTDHDIYPAEIALSKFNLADGVYDTMHFMVNPGKLPLGLASDAKFHSEKTHRLERPPNIEGETDYEVMFKKICSFLETDYSNKKKIPPLFVDPGMNDENMKAAKLTIDKICNETGVANLFRIFPMEYLLYKLNKKHLGGRSQSGQIEFSSVLMAFDTMRSDKHMYADIGCDLHVELDACNHCCLSKVRRWGFTLSEFCSDNSVDVGIPGRHFPITATPSYQIVDDNQSGSTDWDDDISDSFRTISIRTGRTISSTYGSLTSASQYSLSHLGSEADTNSNVDTEDNLSVPLKSPSSAKFESTSLSDLIMLKREAARSKAQQVESAVDVKTSLAPYDINDNVAETLSDFSSVGESDNVSLSYAMMAKRGGMIGRGAKRGGMMGRGANRN